LHGALLDSEILAEVYLELIGGRQPDLVLSVVSNNDNKDSDVAAAWTPPKRPQPLPSRISDAESEAHKEFVEKLGGSAVWKQFK